MSDGLAGFTQGLARGSAQLPDVVNQDRARLQQQSQFDTQVALQKDDQKFRAEQAALDEKHKALADEVSLYREALTRGPDGKLAFDPTSPAGQRIDALTRSDVAKAGLDEAALREATDPTNRAMDRRARAAKLASAEAGATADTVTAENAKANAAVDLESKRTKLAAEKQAVIRNAWDLKDYPTNKVIERMKAFSGLSTDAAQRKALEAGIARGEAEIANQKAARDLQEQQFTFEKAAKNRELDFQEKRLDAETKARQEEYAMRATQEASEGRKALINGYMGTLAAKYGTRVPAGEIQRINKFADQLFPIMQDHARLGVSLQAQSKESVGIVAREFDEISGVANALIAHGSPPSPDVIARFKSLVDKSKQKLEDLAYLNQVTPGAQQGETPDSGLEVDATLLSPLPEDIPARIATLDLRTDLSDKQRAAIRNAYLSGKDPVDYLRKNDSKWNWMTYKGHPVPIPTADQINIENKAYNGIGASPLWNRKFTRPLDILVQPLQNIVDEARMITKTAVGGETKIVTRFIDAAVKDDAAYESMYQEVVSKADSPLTAADNPLSASTAAKVFEYVLHNELGLPYKSGKKSLVR